MWRDSLDGGDGVDRRVYDDAEVEN